MLLIRASITDKIPSPNYACYFFTGPKEEPAVTLAPVNPKTKLSPKCRYRRMRFPTNSRPYARLILTLSLLLSIGGCDELQHAPADPRQAIAEGWLDISTSQFDAAEALFIHAAETARPKSAEYLQARYGLANACQHRKPTSKTDEARAIYKTLVELDNAGEIGAWSSLALARIEHLNLYAAGHAKLPEPAEIEAVRRMYQVTIDSFPQTQAAEESAVYSGAALIEQMSAECATEGIAYLTAWIATHKESVYAPAAFGRLAAAYEILNRRTEQLDALIQSLGTDDDPLDDRSAIFYRIAMIADRFAAKPEIAKQYYRKLLENYPTDPRVYACKRNLHRLEGQLAGADEGGRR